MTDLDKFLAWEATTRDTIDFKIAYVDMAGGDLIAGLLLSQIVYYYLPDKKGNDDKLRVFKDGYYWIAKQREDWWDEIRITPKQVDRAMSILEEKGIIIRGYYRFAGDRTTHIRIDPDGFTRAWDEVIRREHRDLPKGNTEVDESVRPLTETTTETTTDIAPDGEKKSLVDSKANSRDATSLPDLSPTDELALWLGQAPAGNDGVLYMLQRSGWRELLEDTELTQMCAAFLEMTNWPVPPSPQERNNWVSAFRDQRDEFGASVVVKTYPGARDWLRDQQMNIASPRSLTKTIRLILRGELSSRQEQSLVSQWIVTDLRTGEVIS